jgi:hypothetical protein
MFYSFKKLGEFIQKFKEHRCRCIVTFPFKKKSTSYILYLFTWIIMILFILPSMLCQCYHTQVRSPSENLHSPYECIQSRDVTSHNMKCEHVVYLPSIPTNRSNLQCSQYLDYKVNWQVDKWTRKDLEGSSYSIIEGIVGRTRTWKNPQSRLPVSQLRLEASASWIWVRRRRHSLERWTVTPHFQDFVVYCHLESFK